MPNFCIAEVFNTFAKLKYRKEKISDEVYKTLKDKFRNLIRGGRIIYHYELSRYHILNVDYIVAFEHQFKIHSKEFLSTFDILIISMGIELVRIHGDKNFYIITNDKRISSFCKNLRRLSSKKRSEFGIPEYIVYPQVIYLKEDEIPSLS